MERWSFSPTSCMLDTVSQRMLSVRSMQDLLWAEVSVPLHRGVPRPAPPPHTCTQAWKPAQLIAQRWSGGTEPRAAVSSRLHPLGLVQASTQLQAPHVTEKPGLAPPCPESGRASHFCCGAPTLPLLDERPPRLSILFTSFPIKASICTPRNYLSLGRRQRAAWLDPGHRVWSLWVPVQI